MSDPSKGPSVGDRGENVGMIRSSLEGIPSYALPGGFSIRAFRPGDEEAWTRIWMTADIFSMVTPETFAREFGPRSAALPERMLLFCDTEGTEIGTATAWFPNADIDPEAGLVHWVAILPPFHGQHLAKPLLAAVLRRLRDLDYPRAALRTQEARLAAINLYLELDFVPAIQNETEREAWHRVREQLRGSRLDALDLDA